VKNKILLLFIGLLFISCAHVPIEINIPDCSRIIKFQRNIQERDILIIMNIHKEIIDLQLNIFDNDILVCNEFKLEVSKIKEYLPSSESIVKLGVENCNRINLDSKEPSK